MFILNPRQLRWTGRNTPTGNSWMNPSHITACRLLNRCGEKSSARRGFRATGFTLLEILIVVTIIMILAGIAIGRYEESVLRSKEAVLKQDLFVMRNAIQQLHAR